jgi:glycerol-3-phosphate acyltransferase PlsY
MLDYIIVGIIGYLIGSIPFGFLLTKFAGYGDIRCNRFRQYRRDECAAHGK